MNGAGEILALVGRTGILWLTALVIFRFMGKRTLGKMGPFDYAVMIMIGEAVAIGMEDIKVPLANAIAITLALGLLQWLLTYLNARFRWLERLTQGVSTPVVVQGRVQEQALRRERMSHADLMMELRQNDTPLKDVKEARLEPTGKISVIKAKKSANKTPGSQNSSDTASSGEPANRSKNSPGK